MDTILSTMTRLQERLSLLINQTPTSPLRNELCDENIKTLYHIAELQKNKIFTQAQITEILALWDQSLNPENYPATKDLTPNIFMDAPLGQAQKWGIVEPFLKASTYLKKQK